MVEDKNFAKGLAFGILTVFIWGAWPVVTRLGVQTSFSPYDITAIRFFVSGVILLPVYFRLRSSEVNMRAALIMAFCAGAPYVLVTALGFVYAPAGHGGIIIPSTMLICTMIGSWVLFGDRPDMLRSIGYVVVVLGIIFIGAKSFTSNTGNSLIGDLVFVVGGILWAIYTLANRVYGVSALHSSTVVCVLSLVTFVPGYAATGMSNLWQAGVGDILIQVLYQGVAIAIVGMICFTRTVVLLGPARGTLFAALVPASTILLAIPVLGETPTIMELAGLFLVSSGMVLALGLFNRKAR